LNALVLACADGIPGLAPEEWLWLRTADVRVVPGLCRDPDIIARHAFGASSLVLAFCSSHLPRGPVQAAVRRAALDPLGVEVVDLRVAGDDIERLILMLEAAVARASSFAGSAPENARMILPRAVTRRALLKLRIAEYVAVPSIEPSRCVAHRGCRACVEACPRGAITFSDAAISIDAARCDPCGLCTSACPVEAVVDPTVTPAQLDAQVRALLDPSVGPPGPRGILFTCRRSRLAEAKAGWYPVELPCTGMAPASWLLAPLLLGAAAVGVRLCGVSGCPLGRDEVVRDRVAFSRRLLGAIGWSEDRVAAGPVGLPQAPVLGRSFAPHDAFEPGAAGRVLLALAERGTDGHATDGHGFDLAHPGSPVGIVDIRADACTVCGMCARTCPTEALVFAPRDGTVDITFDGVRCTACGQCVVSCPEAARGAIAVRRVASRDVLARGATRLVGSDVASCLRCGQPVAPLTMLSRVAELLGPEAGRMTRLLESYCLDCRAIGIAFSDEPAPATRHRDPGAAMTIRK
jgi:ferredoxin